MASPLRPRGSLQYLFLAAAAVFILAPFAWILMTSFKYQIEIFKESWIFQPTLANYLDVFSSRRSDFMTNVSNSLIVASLSTLFVLTIGVPAAYSLNRFAWRKWVIGTVLGALLVFYMIPVMTLVGPLYLIFRELGLYNTRTALVLTHMTINLPMTVWLMLAFFREVPKELEEAAQIDGCGKAQAFWVVALPLVVPGLIAAGILAFVFSWNEFPIALTLTLHATATVPVGIAQFAQQFEIQHGQMAAASIVATAPAILLMFFGQRFVIQGLTLGSVKG
ncbi:MAG TPA: carbohydrate ABC transporter permease [Stellaceae bacterium]|nr:carbohydrate ABC transporter permease [Stellaceae bacterium]